MSEVLEETGIKIALPATLTGVYKNMQLGVVALVFRCRPLAERPRATDEAKAASKPYWPPGPRRRFSASVLQSGMSSTLLQ